MHYKLDVKWASHIDDISRHIVEMGTGKPINWTKYFDRIFCIFYLPYQSHRVRLEKELARVGILDSGIFQYKYTYPSPYDKIIQDSFEDKHHIERIAAINETLAYLDIMQESIALEYKRVLVIEDDIVFLKNIDEIRNILDMMPRGFHIVQFDQGMTTENVNDYRVVREVYPINKYFANSTGHWFGTSTCNAYTRTGMVDVAQFIEKKPVAIDTLSQYVKTTWAIATKRLCVQCFYADSTSGKISETNAHKPYTLAGVNYDEYNFPDGYVKGSLL